MNTREMLDQQERLPIEDQFEIIVVDGGSTDRTVQLAKEHTDKVIVKPSPVGAALGIRRFVEASKHHRTITFDKARMDYES